MPQGQGQVIAKFDQYRSDGFSSRDGFSQEALRTHLVRQTGEVYGEFGVTPQITLESQLSYQQINEGDGRAQKAELLMGARQVLFRFQPPNPHIRPRQSPPEPRIGFKGLNLGQLDLGKDLLSDQDWVISAGGALGVRAGDPEAFRTKEIAPLKVRQERSSKAWETEGFSELRLALGHSSRILYKRYYFDLSYARRIYDLAPDQERISLISGVEVRKNLWFLSQTYMGRETLRTGARWHIQETGIEYRKGTISYQAGWRHVLDGTSVRKGGGPVLAIWKRF